MSTLQEQVDKLIERAASTDKSEDAMRFSQAALNAANTKKSIADFPQPKE